MLGLPDVSLPVEAETVALDAVAAETPRHTRIVWSLRSQLLRSVALLTNQPAQLSDFRERAHELCSGWFEQIVAAAFKAGPLVDFVGSPAAYYAMHGKHCTHCCILSDSRPQCIFYYIYIYVYIYIYIILYIYLLRHYVANV